MPYLQEGEFKQVVRNSPLVSIDLIIENSKGQVLLGFRTNQPAKGCWFVPGGRIQKDESFEKAFNRLTLNELNQTVSISEAFFIGPFEHFYNENSFNDLYSTHYIVLGYRLSMDVDLNMLPKEQHEQYKWFDKKELKSNPNVHKHTKWYFLND